MQRLFIHIAELGGLHTGHAPLRGKELAHWPHLRNAWLLTNHDRIAAFGAMADLTPALQQQADEVVDVAGGLLLPGFIDAHTHLVHAGSREHEFLMKLQGATYASIAAAGGGILSTAKAVQTASEDELCTLAYKRLQQAIGQGTVGFEIKSGYGLTVADELKMLRVIQRLQQMVSVPIKASLLGAHAIPPNYNTRRKEWVQIVVQELLPAAAEAGLADYVDVFCEEGFFSIDDMLAIMAAGKKHGLAARVHVNQLTDSGAVEAAIAAGACTVDHLEQMTDKTIQQLALADTIGVLLPTAAWFLRLPFPPVRQLISAGAAIALASDFNPGSSPSSNMHWVLALACVQMKMTPAEAWNAASFNAACSLGWQHELGSIAIGKKASFIVSRPMPSLEYWPYAFGSNHIAQVYVNGQLA
ncbi:MAG: imidazolonepropionase [Chitinophagaceae bacterium]|nr:imidazolonepropionase [Chitinophagaceae bacterium]